MTQHTKPFWWWPLMAVGTVCVAHVLHLGLGYGMFHFGLVVIGLIGVASLALGLSVLRFGWPACRAWLREHHARLWTWRVVWVSFATWLTSLLLFHLLTGGDHSVDVRKVKSGSRLAILILGSGTPHCVASPNLVSRLDTGLALARRWPDAPVIVSGGKDFGLHCTEAQVMGDYLRAKGLDATRIVQEDRSTSTHENLVFSAALLQARGFDKTRDTLVVVTNEFHTLRARYIARAQGFAHVASESAPTPLLFRTAATVREYFTYISGKLLNEF